MTLETVFHHSICKHVGHKFTAIQTLASEARKKVRLSHDEIFKKKLKLFFGFTSLKFYMAARMTHDLSSTPNKTVRRNKSIYQTQADG